MKNVSNQDNTDMDHTIWDSKANFIVQFIDKILVSDKYHMIYQELKFKSFS